MIWPAFTPAQSPSSAVVQNSRASQIDLKKLTKKANSGDATAQFKLGYAYHFGVGVDKNVYQAIEWYRKAGNYSHPAAQTNLGYIYETGPEAVKDLHEAVKWYMRAAVSGNPEGAFNLGLAYLHGTGVNQSIDDARQWIGRAANAGCPEGLATLAYLYAVGKGVSQDSQQAQKLALKDCRQNVAHAFLAEGDGQGMAPDRLCNHFFCKYDRDVFQTIPARSYTLGNHAQRLVGFNGRRTPRRFKATKADY
jgi:TPR repeat protein